jgi:hypothetical protein
VAGGLASENRSECGRITAKWMKVRVMGETLWNEAVTRKGNKPNERQYK